MEVSLMQLGVDTLANQCWKDRDSLVQACCV